MCVCAETVFRLAVVLDRGKKNWDLRVLALCSIGHAYEPQQSIRVVGPNATVYTIRSGFLVPLTTVLGFQIQIL